MQRSIVRVGPVFHLNIIWWPCGC